MLPLAALTNGGVCCNKNIEMYHIAKYFNSYVNKSTSVKMLGFQNRQVTKSQKYKSKPRYAEQGIDILLSCQVF